MTARQQSHTFKLLLFAGLFCMGVVLANIVAIKRIVIGPFSMPAGVFLFALTFMCTDVVFEGWGKKIAHRVVWAGLIANLVAMLYIRIAMAFTPAPTFMHNDAFNTILGGNMRIVFAGLATYCVSQNLDVYIFGKIRKATGSKHLWLRNSASTLISQIVDSSMFLTLAFFGNIPMSVIASMILPTVLFKWMVVICDTPLCYWGVHWVRKTCDRELTEEGDM